jgi:hypothetical protein
MTLKDDEQRIIRDFKASLEAISFVAGTRGFYDTLEELLPSHTFLDALREALRRWSIRQGVVDATVQQLYSDLRDRLIYIQMYYRPQVGQFDEPASPVTPRRSMPPNARVSVSHDSPGARRPMQRISRDGDRPVMGNLDDDSDDDDGPIGDFDPYDDYDPYDQDREPTAAELQMREAFLADLARNQQPQDHQTHQGAEFLEEQATQMGEPSVYSPKTLEAHNVALLGADYRTREVFDVITQDDVKIGDYLDESPDNIVFVLKKRGGSDIFFSERRRVATLLPVYECVNAESMAAFTDNVYINVTNLGAPFVGVADYRAFKTHVMNTNYQVFMLRHSGRNTGPLVTYRVRHLRGNWVGDSHCQTGSDVPYYATFIPCEPLGGANTP